MTIAAPSARKETREQAPVESSIPMAPLLPPWAQGICDHRRPNAESVVELRADYRSDTFSGFYCAVISGGGCTLPETKRRLRGGGRARSFAAGRVLVSGRDKG